MKPYEILDRAATLIEDRAVDVPAADGLVRKDWYLLVADGEGDLRDPEACPVCTAAAINVAGGCAPDDPAPTPQVVAALEVFAAHLGLEIEDRGLAFFVHPTLNAVAAWHDRVADSAAHVAAELRAAAQAEQAKEAA